MVTRSGLDYAGCKEISERTTEILKENWGKPCIFQKYYNSYLASVSKKMSFDIFYALFRVLRRAQEIETPG